MAAELVREHPLKILKPPVEIPGFTMCQGWHETHRNDPGHRWLRDALINAAKGKKLIEGTLTIGATPNPRR
jgi:DNA-binding transcriptional LysR family regulator